MVPVPENILSLVHPEFRDEFLHFLQTGEASPAFLGYLDGDENCQLAMERVFAEKAAPIRAGVEEMRRAVTEGYRVESRTH